MDGRTRRNLTYILLGILIGNLAIGYARSAVDYSAVAISIAGLIGILHGTKRNNDDDKGDGA